MLFLPCYPSTVIAPAEFACLSLFAMPCLPLLLLLWLHHHIVPFLFEPLVLVNGALPSVLPLLLPVAAQAGRQAGVIGFITLQQSAPSQMTWQDSNAFREH